MLSNRLLTRLFTNLRYLSQQGVVSLLAKSSTASIHSTSTATSSFSTSTSSSSASSSATPVSQLRQQTPSLPSALPSNGASTSTSSSCSIGSVSCDKLRLVTAYSGYSKDVNFLNTPGANSSTSKFGIQLLSRKKGVIGDDAWFIASQKCADVMGVADGVGGWRTLGVDPSKFSSNLMRTCKRLVEQELGSTLFANSQNVNKKTPIEILSSSYQALLENKNQSVIGSSTACIIVFNRESNCLHSANLGDSGFVVIRGNKIVHRSQEQTHYFNSPFQMAILPSLGSTLLLQNPPQPASFQQHEQQQQQRMQPLDTSTLINDSPDLASVSSFDLREGDFIVVATDGLWDNLNEKALLLEISKIKSFLLEDLEKAAQTIARKAIELAYDPDYISPFALAARQNGIELYGGKPDDVTVLLARVSR